MIEAKERFMLVQLQKRHQLQNLRTIFYKSKSKSCILLMRHKGRLFIHSRRTVKPRKNGCQRIENFSPIIGGFSLLPLLSPRYGTISFIHYRRISIALGSVMAFSLLLNLGRIINYFVISHVHLYKPFDETAFIHDFHF